MTMIFHIVQRGITNINVNNAYDDYNTTFTDDKQNNYSTNEKKTATTDNNKYKNDKLRYVS